jgi:glucoamylase
MPWRFTLRPSGLGVGQKLRLETFAPTQVHWTADNWLSVNDQTSCDTGLGLHVTDLPTEELDEGAEIIFTFFWPQENRWEGGDFAVRVLPTRVLEPISEKVSEVEAIRKTRRTVRRTTEVKVRRKTK